MLVQKDALSNRTVHDFEQLWATVMLINSLNHISIRRTLLGAAVIVCCLQASQAEAGMLTAITDSTEMSRGTVVSRSSETSLARTGTPDEPSPTSADDSFGNLGIPFVPGNSNAGSGSVGGIGQGAATLEFAIVPSSDRIAFIGLQMSNDSRRPPHASDLFRPPRV